MRSTAVPIRTPSDSCDRKLHSLNSTWRPPLLSMRTPPSRLPSSRPARVCKIDSSSQRACEWRIASCGALLSMCFIRSMQMPVMQSVVSAFRTRTIAGPADPGRPSDPAVPGRSPSVSLVADVPGPLASASAASASARRPRETARVPAAGARADRPELRSFNSSVSSCASATVDFLLLPPPARLFRRRSMLPRRRSSILRAALASWRARFCAFRALRCARRAARSPVSTAPQGTSTLGASPRWQWRDAVVSKLAVLRRQIRKGEQVKL